MKNVTVETRPVNGTSRWALFLLLLLLLAGLYVRVATIENQSLWFDEAHWVCKMVESPSLAAWMKASDGANRDMVPLYFILEYGWYHWLFPSITAMRWLSVLIGLAAILMTYHFARGLYGVPAGLLAAACCSLSPLQIHYSQELRPYGLMVLLTLVAAHAFHAALYRGGRRWWALNILANSLLMWTHLFGLWFIAVQGLFLLLFHFRPFWRLLSWAVANAVLMIPVGMLVLTWQQPGNPPLVTHWVEVVSSWCCLDMFYLALLVYYRTGSPSADLFAGLPACFLQIFPAVVLIVSVTLLGMAMYRCVRAGRGTRAFPVIGSTGSPAAAEKRMRRMDFAMAVFLLMWYALPALMILLFSLLVVPAFQLRYVIYSAPALYMLAAGGIAAIRNKWCRGAAAGLLLITLGFTAFLAMKLPVRPDYMGAARYVQAHAGADERILWNPALTRDTFVFNLDAHLPRIVPEAQTRLCGEFAEIDTALEQSTGIWVLHALWSVDQAAVRAGTLERYLDARGIQYEKRIFPGRWDVIVYHCSRSSSYQPDDLPESIGRLQSKVSPALYDAPMRWSLYHALITAGRFSEAAESCFRELDGIPSSAPEREDIETKLGNLGWDDNVPDGTTCLDRYVADFMGLLETALMALPPHESHLKALNGRGAQFPGNNAAQAVLEHYRAYCEGRVPALPIH